MVQISTLVFFDLETTGLPYQERNRTKIIELALVAVTRRDFMRNKDTVPPVCKLSLVFNPQKTIHSAEITGLTNDFVKYSPSFKDKFNTIKSFLDDLKKPVCLVAHNGNCFDYKILLAECMDADVRLPKDLLCGDSITYFRKMFKNIVVEQQKTPPIPLQPQIAHDALNYGELTDDDDDEWPELNVTSEDLEEIDNLSSSLSDMSCECESSENSANIANNENKPYIAEINKIKSPKTYKLTDIYRTLLGKEPQNAHRAESDCLMLLQCVGFCQNSLDLSDDFITWIDKNCKPLNEIRPLIRK